MRNLVSEQDLPSPKGLFEASERSLAADAARLMPGLRMAACVRLVRVLRTDQRPKSVSETLALDARIRQKAAAAAFRLAMTIRAHPSLAAAAFHLAASEVVAKSIFQKT